MGNNKHYPIQYYLAQICEMISLKFLVFQDWIPRECNVRWVRWAGLFSVGSSLYTFTFSMRLFLSSIILPIFPDFVIYWFLTIVLISIFDWFNYLSTSENKGKKCIDLFVWMFLGVFQCNFWNDKWWTYFNHFKIYQNTEGTQKYRFPKWMLWVLYF